MMDSVESELNNTEKCVINETGIDETLKNFEIKQILSNPNFEHTKLNILSEKENAEEPVHPERDCDGISPEENSIMKNDSNSNSQSIDDSYKGDIEEFLPDFADRIAQCQSIISSIKIELNEEKMKRQQESDIPQCSLPEVQYTCCEAISHNFLPDQLFSSDYFNDGERNMPCYNKKLLEYEKQLQRYQNTLNMAQNAKKNAIRRQMLAKAFKLKLLEIESQCNIELLRIKQNIQCLEPLKLIAESWKTGTDGYDSQKYDLMPLFPDFQDSFTSDYNPDYEK